MTDQSDLTGFDFILADLQSRYLRSLKTDAGQTPPTLAHDYDLIENRVLDSLAFVEFILLVEEHSGQEISIDSVSKEDFRTVDALRKRFFDGS
jgi:acyl carrier protein